MVKKNRHKSSIINLRLFHNWIKRTTIEETVKYLNNEYGISNPKLLDLAVGRGGDMRKWYDNNIYDVVGIDIDDKSINGQNGAKDRFSKFKNYIAKHGKRVPRYEFHVYDLSKSRNIQKIDQVVKNRKFNIVSCQFAIHYFFESPEKLDTFINIATRYMEKDAFFIGTTLDGKKVNKLFEETNEIEKDLYYFKKRETDLSTPYGNTYLVSLGRRDGRDDHYFVERASLEYMVDINELKKICEKYGLQFIGIVPFSEWYGRYKGKPLKYQEKEFSFLNFSFVFKKNS